ncbi:MAG: HAD-IIA family hydrolase [Ruminococcaceae bacterium]|nr:HAD-IIA family hydrolase [Oscillospiraceae bacterium]
MVKSRCEFLEKEFVMDKSLKNVKLFLFDMDGTLYLGNILYDFTIELLNTIRETGSRYLFMTNNSSKSVNAYIEKLEKLGIKADKDDFITSSQATAYYLKNHHKNATLYVCGTQSLKDEFISEGFKVSENIDEVNCIVMGNDTELTFKKLWDVSYLLTVNPDMPYVATNIDYVCPTEFGFVPDCGSFCDMIFNATGKRPVFIGKPEALMPELAMAMTGYSKEQTAVIGDRIYTDIKSGINAGTVTVLVMSGETTYEVLEKSEDKPDFVLKNAGLMIPMIKE